VDGQVTADSGEAGFPGDARIEVGGPAGTDGGANATCVVTREDELGPYYLPGTPERAVLARPGDGQMMVVTGRVRDTRCRGLAGALLDIWSTNVRGEYSLSAQGFGRGKVRADADGAFQFETVLPGAYLGRPRHVHFIVEQPGHARVTTQMYFKGERPDIEALAVPRSLVGGVWECHFDIVLAGGLALRPRRPRSRPRRAA
jgi:protocatechuate 3,4-dioxygenase beta subunit